jgi:hypothetical protein
MVQVDPPGGGPPRTESRKTAVAFYQFFTASKKSAEQAVSSYCAHSAEHIFYFLLKPNRSLMATYR